MANFQYKNLAGTWTNIPSCAYAGTYEGGPVVYYPEAGAYDGSGKPCAAIGNPYITIKSTLMTACGMNFWQGFFDTTESTSASIAIKAHNPRSLWSASAGATAGWSAWSGRMRRPKWDGVRVGRDTMNESTTWFVNVEITIENCETTT